jgi:copper chaperone CopZ
MKNYFQILLIFTTSIIFSQTSKNEKTSFGVNGNCEMCKMRIEKAAISVKGVKYANWNIPESILTLVYNSKKVSLSEIHTSIADSGHDTSEANAPNEVYNQLPTCCLYIRKQKK